MPFLKAFSLESGEENSRLLKNIERLRLAKNQNFSRFVVEALSFYVEREMRLFERQTSIEESIDMKEEDTKIADSKFIAIKSKFIAINIPKESDPRDAEWLASEQRKKALAEAPKKTKPSTSSHPFIFKVSK